MRLIPLMDRRSAGMVPMRRRVHRRDVLGDAWVGIAVQAYLVRSRSPVEVGIVGAEQMRHGGALG